MKGTVWVKWEEGNDAERGAGTETSAEGEDELPCSIPRRMGKLTGQIIRQSARGFC